MLLKSNSLHKAATRPPAVGPRVVRVRPALVVVRSSPDGGLPESNGVATKLKEQEELVQVSAREECDFFWRGDLYKNATKLH